MSGRDAQGGKPPAAQPVTRADEAKDDGARREPREAAPPATRKAARRPRRKPFVL